jgi:hypothetical protein
MKWLRQEAKHRTRFAESLRGAVLPCFGLLAFQFVGFGLICSAGLFQVFVISSPGAGLA